MFTVPSQIRQRCDQQVPLLTIRLRGNRAHLIHDNWGAQLIGQSQGLLGGHHSSIELISHVVPMAGVESDRAHPQIQICEHFPQLPQSGLRKIGREDLMARSRFPQLGPPNALPYARLS